jgi:hypothetical protein
MLTESSLNRGRWQPESPFEDIPTFEVSPAPIPSAGGTDTPFLAEYFVGEVSTPVSADRDELLELVHELYDAEFDALVAELGEAAVAASEAAGAPPERREAFVRHYLAPLQREAERVLDAVAQAAGDRDLATVGEGELEELFDAAEPAATDLSSLFEDFLGGLVKKVKAVAKKGLDIAKKAAGSLLPINAILGRLKGLVRPLLERVLKFALDKLPPALRPMASRLARKLLGRAGLEAEEPGLDEEGAATADVAAIQQEFDLAAASLLFAVDPVEGEVAVAELASEVDAEDSDVIDRLQQARERFASEIVALEPGADPQPVIERFVPAILPLVKTGIGLIGRQRVVNFLARYLAKLIARYVGQQGAKALSRAIVDAGLRLVSLEAPPEVEQQAAGSALAATVEDTVRRLGELDEFALDDETLLEGAIYEAFEEAAAANLPQALLKPQVREAAGVNGVWTPLPLGGVKAYKRYSRPLETTVTPQIARRLPSWGGVPLADVLRARYEVEGPVRAVAHLYEAIPGTRLARIARQEGSRTDRLAGSSEFHPLTPQAAGMLFGEPGLGRTVGEAFEDDPTYIAAGQRFFRLEVPGARRAAAPAQPSRVRVVLNLRPAKREIVARLYFSERDAQQIAARINSGADPATVAGLVLAPARASLAQTLRGQGGALRPIGEDELFPRRLRGTVRRGLRWIARTAPRVLRGLRLAEWAHQAILGSAGFAREFATAAASERDGVTVVVTFERLPGLDTLGRLLRHGEPNLPQLRGVAVGAPERTSVRVVAGEQK